MRMIIGGEFCDAADGRVYEVKNPATTGEVIDKVPQAGPADVALRGPIAVRTRPAAMRQAI
jgi:acyl-CoA reductase-like NAD-dependent aldehyde dehydrogenase